MSTSNKCKVNSQCISTGKQIEDKKTELNEACKNAFPFINEETPLSYGYADIIPSSPIVINSGDEITTRRTSFADTRETCEIPGWERKEKKMSVITCTSGPLSSNDSKSLILLMKMDICPSRVTLAFSTSPYGPRFKSVFKGSQKIIAVNLGGQCISKIPHEKPVVFNCVGAPRGFYSIWATIEQGMLFLAVQEKKGSRPYLIKKNSFINGIFGSSKFYLNLIIRPKKSWRGTIFKIARMPMGAINKRRHDRGLKINSISEMAVLMIKNTEALINAVKKSGKVECMEKNICCHDIEEPCHSRARDMYVTIGHSDDERYPSLRSKFSDMEGMDYTLLSKCFIYDGDSVLFIIDNNDLMMQGITSLSDTPFVISSRKDWKHHVSSADIISKGDEFKLEEPIIIETRMLFRSKLTDFSHSAFV